MKISKTVKGIAFGTSLAAFSTFAFPATSHAELLASEQIGGDQAKPAGDHPDKKDDKKKKKGGKDGEKSCGGEGGCGGKKDEPKK